MTLKELTKEKHDQAENTRFMRAVFKGTMPRHVWANFTYNKILFYGAIETKSHALGLMHDLNGLDRTYRLYEDFRSMAVDDARILPTVQEYCRYIFDLEADKVMSHLYVWHMGDLHGGQMIKRLIPVQHRSLEFDNTAQLIAKIRSKLNPSHGPEAIVAFDWAIKIMNEYDHDLSNL
jgi:heme oxygenase